MMRVLRWHGSASRLLTAAALFLTAFLVPAGGSGLAVTLNSPPMVVIDPGHGGYDTGIALSEAAGISEKNVNLALARMLKKRLEKRYRVILTRTGDYFLSSPDRVAKANQARADFFIAIHGGGGFSPKNGETTVWVLKKRMFSADKGSFLPDFSPSKKGPVLNTWPYVQQRHYQASKQAADIVRKTLADELKGACRLREARLAVLEGADMPAVMVEIKGLLQRAATTPPEDSAYFSQLADALAGAVDGAISDLN